MQYNEKAYKIFFEDINTQDAIATSVPHHKRMKKWYACHLVSLGPQSETVFVSKSKPCLHIVCYSCLHIGWLQEVLATLQTSHCASLWCWSSWSFLLTSSSLIIVMTTCWTNNGTATRDCCMWLPARDWVSIQYTLCYTVYILCSTDYKICGLQPDTKAQSQNTS